jgi:PAS domain S-box-containing protein
MAYMAFSGHDSEQPVNPSDVHLVINLVPAFIHTAMPDGYLDFFNETSLTYMGRSLEDVQGWKWISSIHPDDVEGIVAKWRASLASGELFLYEARVQRADGEYRWMLHHKVPRRDTNGIIIKWYGSSIDIEDRKRAEKKVRNEGLMINTIPVLAWACRPDGAAYFLNQRWLDYTGFSLEQGCGWGWKSALHPDDVEHLLTMWQGLLESGEPGEVSARIRRFDGEYRWFIFQARPVRDNRGKVVTWYGTNADIEDRRRAEEELRRSESQGCEPVATCS